MYKFKEFVFKHKTVLILALIIVLIPMTFRYCVPIRAHALGGTVSIGLNSLSYNYAPELLDKFDIDAQYLTSSDFSLNSTYGYVYDYVNSTEDVVGFRLSTLVLDEIYGLLYCQIIQNGTIVQTISNSPDSLNNNVEIDYSSGLELNFGIITGDDYFTQSITIYVNFDVDDGGEVEPDPEPEPNPDFSTPTSNSFEFSLSYNSNAIAGNSNLVFAGSNGVFINSNVINLGTKTLYVDTVDYPPFINGDKYYYGISLSNVPSNSELIVYDYNGNLVGSHSYGVEGVTFEISNIIGYRFVFLYGLNTTDLVDFDIIVYYTGLTGDELTAWREGFEAGKQAGLSSGYNQGYLQGKNDGYNEGWLDASEDSTGWLTLLTRPLLALNEFTIANISGVDITIGGIMYTMIGTFLLLAFLKFFAGG